MNVKTIICLVIWVLCMLVLTVNVSIMTYRASRMRKGKTPQGSFITKRNKGIMWGAFAVSYIAIILFCIFLNATPMEKIKAFAIIAMVVPFQPMGLSLIILYSLLFITNQRYISFVGHETGDSSSSQEENQK